MSTPNIPATQTTPSAADFDQLVPDSSAEQHSPQANPPTQPAAQPSEQDADSGSDTQAT